MYRQDAVGGAQGRGGQGNALSEPGTWPVCENEAMRKHVSESFWVRMLGGQVDSNGDVHSLLVDEGIRLQVELKARERNLRHQSNKRIGGQGRKHVASQLVIAAARALAQLVKSGHSILLPVSHAGRRCMSIWDEIGAGLPRVLWPDVETWAARRQYADMIIDRSPAMTRIPQRDGPHAGITSK